MADIVSFPPAATPPATPEHEALRQSWRMVDDSVHTIIGILDAVNGPAGMTDDQKFRLEWELEWLRTIVRADAFQDMRLSADEYRRRRERLLRSIGLGHMI